MGASRGSDGGMGRARVLQLPSAQPALLVGLRPRDPPVLILSTLNFSLKSQKSSLKLSDYKTARLEVVRAYSVRHLPLPAGDCSGGNRWFKNGNLTNYTPNSFSSSTSAAEIHSIILLSKQHEWIIKFHSQIICKADWCRVFVSLSKLGNVSLSQCCDWTLARKKYEYPNLRGDKCRGLIAWHAPFGLSEEPCLVRSANSSARPPRARRQWKMR